jgi:hypothetical protein
MLVHKKAPKYFCTKVKFTKYNGASLCIHALRQFYASHVYNAWQEDAKYGNILVRHRMVSYSKKNHILYYLCRQYFHFSFFLLCCSVSRTVVKQHFTLPSHS